MAVIPLEFITLGRIPLRVWVVGLPKPSECVAYILHDSNILNGLNVEVVLGDTSVVSL